MRLHIRLFPSKLALHPKMDGQMQLESFKDHDQWTLERPLLVSVLQKPTPVTSAQLEVVFHLKIKRNSKFYQIVFVYPAFLLYFLSPIVFLLSVESGEKNSVIVTLLLAQVVSMSAITEVLPASSRNFPIIAYFLGFSSLHVGIDAVLTVVGKLLFTSSKHFILISKLSQKRHKRTFPLRM